jgi:hypothetical protein
MDKTIIINSLQCYITRKTQKINRIERIIESNPSADNLKNLKTGLRHNKALIKRAEQQILFFENFVFNKL